MSEATTDTILQAGNISVTSTLFRVGNSSYPIAGIGSVTFVRDDSIVWYAFAGLLALASLFVGGMPMCLMLAAALIFAIAGYNRKSSLVVRTASGDLGTLHTKDIDLLTRVRAAIEEAVRRRG